ncbi:MAG: hypothetical protein O7C58_03170 [Rickettsia endosymbiont of Ixodes persulcatus]|nr:hypothetical protein [Rickettsia endosymbiont of Ixodes persulcatus]
MREINVKKATTTPERNNVTIYSFVLSFKAIDVIPRVGALLHGYQIVIASDCKERGNPEKVIKKC